MSRSESEQFWAGSFGSDYTQRNQVDPENRAPFFRRVLALLPDLRSICELGANRGHNLQALASINPQLSLTGVEINPQACAELQAIAGVRAVCSSILEFRAETAFDLVLTSGVLIHVQPAELRATYRKIASLASSYVLLNEYFNPTPVELSYRGHTGKLFKRDFAGEFLDLCPGFEVVAYGFLWKRVEPAWDNSTWTLLGR